ncbi:hypothetical protein Fot_34240 [Forsythia ovata]|uniref:Uncharacterized protein n=1 Tax=Forsythia ovata TaxID=205694 RepID=A0ABD1SL73_9LAMI
MRHVHPPLSKRVRSSDRLYSPMLRYMLVDICLQSFPSFLLPLFPYHNIWTSAIVSHDKLLISSVPKLKIRRGRVVDDISLPLQVSCVVSVPEIVVPQAPEAMVSNSLSVPLALEITSEVPYISLPTGPISPTKNFRRSEKRKAVVGSQGETAVPGRGMEGTENPRRARQGSRTSILPPPGKPKYINIGSRHDELDPTALGKLSAPAAIAATSVHKYWTSAFGKAAENAELMELLKLAEMYTS